MLLMIPVDVIDSVPAVKDFLEDEDIDKSNAKWKLALEEISSRNKSALDKSVSAILFADSAGVIEYFNAGIDPVCKPHFSSCSRNDRILRN